jgi:hypothetical protein
MARSTVLIALLVLATAASARADGLYFSEGIGATRVHDELSAFLPEATHVRVALGMRRHEWAYELYFAGHFDDSYTENNEVNLVSGGLNVKYIQPVASHLEVYLRGSAMFGGTDQALDGFSGRGLGAGAGIQLKGKGSVLGLLWWPLFFLPQGPRMTAALWLDTGYEFYRLQPASGQRNAVDAQLSTITLGVALGTDF